jgi:nucleotide-binding universal stress UspA family protein
LALYGHIVCALDFSPHADAAFRTALELAREEGAELTLLHVYVPGTPLTPGEKPAKAKKLSDQDLAARLRAHMEEKYLAQAGETPCRVVLRRGHPSVEILAHLGDDPADLMVLGSQGLSGMGLVILGSVAEKVVRKAPCDCLLVRPQKAEEA